MLVTRLKSTFKTNEPIFTNEILRLFSEYSRAYVFRLIDDAEEKGELVSFDTGVYYLPVKSIMGVSTITADDVVNKRYIKNRDEVYGVYSGLLLQNMFSATTQMPNVIEVVTNKESMRCRKLMIDGRSVILRKSRFTIDKNNVSAYTILQLFSETDVVFADERVRKAIKQYIIANRIAPTALIELAGAFPAKTAKNLICSGVLNEITQ